MKPKEKHSIDSIVMVLALLLLSVLVFCFIVILFFSSSQNLEFRQPQREFANVLAERQESAENDSQDKSATLELAYTIPTDDDFADYIYSENGHQNVDFFGYFSQHGQINAEVGTRYREEDSDMLIFKPDGSCCSIYQPSAVFADPKRSIARIRIKSPDLHTVWTVEWIESLEDLTPVVADYRMGLRLTEDEFKALVAWAKYDGDYNVNYCPFAGFNIPHTISSIVYDKKTGSTIDFGDVPHED